MSHVPSSQYGSPQMHIGYSQLGSTSRKRSHQDLQLDYQGLQDFQAQAAEAGVEIAVELTPHGQHAQPQAGSMAFPLSTQQQQYQHPPAQQQQQQHHHHRLPNQPLPHKMARQGYGEVSSPPQDHGPPSVVGQEGMPSPALRPRGPKLKFTPEDDQLLVELKETKTLTWKQIADFFPGRSSGTLQVRYCTKLKAKTTLWNDEMVQKLRTAMHEYDNDRWRIISGKVGNGFSPAACREKAAELEEEEQEEEEEEDGDGDGDDQDADAPRATGAAVPTRDYE
ncbi:hypothetical protein LTR50_006176 [Elasticomyces elasticus]|nr:hypothetical protein LTR50_006176 [Elasticomyces elasticus]